MSENYFYSALTAEQIESRLVGGVVFNESQTLSSVEKATARANIGAGTENTGFMILGFFDSIEDLEEWLQLPPQPGDAYGIGVSSPYDIYIWDAAHEEWVNNGPLDTSDFIDDTIISQIKTWSSDKINSTYAPLASPELTGAPKAPTATSGTNTTQIATTAFVKDAVDVAASAATATFATKTDLASISISGTVNDTGETIAKGTFFYLNGALVRAIVDIADGATLTSGTNYNAANDALNTFGAGGWLTLNEYVKYRKVAGIVFVMFANSDAFEVGTTGSAIGTLPLGYRPSTQLDFAITAVAGQQEAMMRVGDDGALTCFSNPASRYQSGCFAFPADQ